MRARLLVVSRYRPRNNSDSDSDGNVQHGSPAGDGSAEPRLGPADSRNDAFDDFNHPRIRRAYILQKLHESRIDAASSSSDDRIEFVTPGRPADDLGAYVDHRVCSASLADFFATAWRRWDALGEAGQDPASSLDQVHNGAFHNDAEHDNGYTGSVSKPLIPGNCVLHRDRFQRPSRNVMGQIGYYCTDTCTPIFAELEEELLWDAATIQTAVRKAIGRQSGNDAGTDQNPSLSYRGVYALCTHPGHHAAYDSFGGYCYINHAALAARLLQQRLSDGQPTQHRPKVAVIDVDYHCGNGTASVFYDDPTVFVVSIHCHPDHEYPFHSGFEDETGVDGGVGTTLHLPLMPQSTWDGAYRDALQKALDRVIAGFGAQALVVSLGLDTYKNDPCSIRRAGFRLEGKDYARLGECVAEAASRQRPIPVVWVQEGGYYMEKVPEAVSDVFEGFLADHAE